MHEYCIQHRFEKELRIKSDQLFFPVCISRSNPFLNLVSKLQIRQNVENLLFNFLCFFITDAYLLEHIRPCRLHASYIWPII